MKRIDSIDLVRGLVMIIMALDHTRDFLHATSITQNPTDLATTTPVLFFTRWITHLCAPTFVFLSGVSAYLSLRRSGIDESRKFLLIRGLWLILLDFTVVGFAFWFDVQFRVMLFEVIATIGFGFIVLGFAIKSSPKSLGIAALVIIFFHDLLFLIPQQDPVLLQRILTPFVARTSFVITPERIFVMGYPPIPWLGMMLAGFAAGSWFELEDRERKRRFLWTGLSALVLFALLRMINVYGDIPWAPQKTPLYSFLSIMNITKYPPSLLFTLLTLGVTFVILGIAEKVKGWLANIVTVYGKVPLFYFVVHLYLIHVLMIVMLLLQGFQWEDIHFAGFDFGRQKTESGVGLGAIYIIWLGVVAALYPACRWYSGYKDRHREKAWLRYL